MLITEVVKLYGAAWSVYVRIARLALEEKQVNYGLIEVDVFAETGVPQEHLKRHPSRLRWHSSVMTIQVGPGLTKPENLSETNDLVV